MANQLHSVRANTFKYKEAFQIRYTQPVCPSTSWREEGPRVSFPRVRPRPKAAESRFRVSFLIGQGSSLAWTDNSKVSPFTEGCGTDRPPQRWAPQPDPINSRQLSQHSQGQGAAAIFPPLGVPLSPCLAEGLAAPWSDKRLQYPACCGPTLADKGRPLCQREENITVP